MAEKTLFRTWTDPDGDYPVNFIKITPDGTILQLSFAQDKSGDQVKISKSSVNSFYLHDVFSIHKTACSKSKWMKAQKQARRLVKEVSLDLNDLIQ